MEPRPTTYIVQKIEKISLCMNCLNYKDDNIKNNEGKKIKPEYYCTENNLYLSTIITDLKLIVPNIAQCSGYKARPKPN